MSFLELHHFENGRRRRKQITCRDGLWERLIYRALLEWAVTLVVWIGSARVEWAVTFDQPNMQVFFVSTW